MLTAGIGVKLERMALRSTVTPHFGPAFLAIADCYRSSQSKE